MLPKTKTRAFLTKIKTFEKKKYKARLKNTFELVVMALVDTGFIDSINNKKGTINEYQKHISIFEKENDIMTTQKSIKIITKEKYKKKVLLKKKSIAWENKVSKSKFSYYYHFSVEQINFSFLVNFIAPKEKRSKIFFILEKGQKVLSDKNDTF